MKDRFLKRLRKKAKKGMHGWPAARPIDGANRDFTARR